MTDFKETILTYSELTSNTVDTWKVGSYQEASQHRHKLQVASSNMGDKVSLLNRI